MTTIAPTLLGIILLSAAPFSSAQTLQQGSTLLPGQSIYSDNREYKLVMQEDGNLVYYRVADGAVRWSIGISGIPGNFLVMQDDGNAVTYYDPPLRPPVKGGPPVLDKPRQGRYPTWSSSTAGHSGAFLRPQNDGNLVIFAAGGYPIWSIGGDPDLIKPEPRQAGDVVGRELASIIAAPGHVGFYDGTGIYQVMNEKPVVQKVSIEKFKAPVAAQGPNAYWGAGYPNIPSFYVKGCFEVDCSNKPEIVVDSRTGMSLRAFQIWQLGAEYTISTTGTPAFPKNSTTPAKRGVYRCDTFVIDIYKIFGTRITDSRGAPIQATHPDSPVERWINFRTFILTDNLIPTVVFQKLKAYK